MIKKYVTRQVVLVWGLYEAEPMMSIHLQVIYRGNALRRNL